MSERIYKREATDSPYLLPNLPLDIVDRVRGLDPDSDFLHAIPHEYAHSALRSTREEKRRLVLDVIILKGPAILELLAAEDETLLVGRDTAKSMSEMKIDAAFNVNLPLLVLDLSLHVVDCVGRCDPEGDRVPHQRLDEDLHTTTETKVEMEGGLLLNVIILKGSSVLGLAVFKFEAIEAQGDAMKRDQRQGWEAIPEIPDHLPIPPLNLDSNVVAGCRRFDLKGDRLSSEGLDEGLHVEVERRRGESERVSERGRRSQHTSSRKSRAAVAITPASLVQTRRRELSSCAFRVP